METTQYTGSVAWLPAPAPAPAGGRFAPATVYRATITLTAKPGFTLTGVAEDFFTVASGSITGEAPRIAVRLMPEAAARFRDADGWAQGSIGAALEAGIIAGYADNTFGGSRRITRAEMAVILQRVLSKVLVSVTRTAEAEFADVNTFPTWAADGIKAASRAGLVRGFQDRTFRPDNTTTRAETAVMLYRLIAER